MASRVLHLIFLLENQVQFQTLILIVAINIIRWIIIYASTYFEEITPISFKCIGAQFCTFNLTKFSLNLYAFNGILAIFKEKFATNLFISFHLQTYFWSAHTFYECFLCVRPVCRFAKKYARNSLALMSWNPKPVWKGQWGFCTSGADPHSVGIGTVPECSVIIYERARTIDYTFLGSVKWAIARFTLSTELRLRWARFRR